LFSVRAAAILALAAETRASVRVAASVLRVLATEFSFTRGVRRLGVFWVEGAGACGCGVFRVEGLDGSVPGDRDFDFCFLACTAGRPKLKLKAVLPAFEMLLPLARKSQRKRLKVIPGTALAHQPMLGTIYTRN
jgi:hypothetical protein